MLAKNVKKTLSLFLSLVFATASSPALYGYQSQSSSPSADTGSPTEPLPQTAAELESLVAPIALYPDALVAQILSAATFPDQVAIADYWLQENKNLTGSTLMQAVDKQTWDPSVKALTQFPSVLENMAKNLSWTSSLGEAFHGQQAEVMTAIQTLRAKAKTAGNLKTTSQVTVVQQSFRKVIVIQPDKSASRLRSGLQPGNCLWLPYTWFRRMSMFLSSPVWLVAGGSSGSVPALAVGAMMSGGGGCCGWGYSSWNCVAGMGPRWSTTAECTTETLPGTGATTTAAITTATATTIPTTTTTTIITTTLTTTTVTKITETPITGT